MPYREGSKWRGVASVKGERIAKSFRLKKEAVAWENQAQKDLKKSREEAARRHGLAEFL